MKKKEINLKTYLIPKLRSISLYWPGRTEALKKAQLARGQYQCNHCKQVFKRTELHVDHIDPVIDINDGWKGFDEFIPRLFCSVEGLQCLCKVCHDIKTETEKTLRMDAKTKKKELEKSK
jgi:5-methylcytosine-specific restriction endonuclease McrA